MTILLPGHLRLDDRRALIAFIAAPPLAYLAGRLLLGFVRSASRSTPVIHRSPAKSVDDLTTAELALLPYPPDALPGGRDVDSPWGSTRVYEWGPEAGRKVLFVHGISTPCIAFARMARALAERDGCRVMLFDLFGRGYSDGPSVRQDAGLFAAQILLVLASSRLSWTGGEAGGFTLVGYSLGGGVAASFASFFPKLVDSLVLIAPAGLMRPSRIHWTSRLIYGGMTPGLMREYLVRRRLVGRPPAKRAEEQKLADGTPAGTATEPELGGEHPALAADSAAPLFPYRGASAAETVAWQVQAHPGFLPAFISSIQHAPVSGEHARWRLIGSRLTAQRAGGAGDDAEGVRELGLREGKVLIIFGRTDEVVVAEETAEDAIEVLGEENVRVEVLEGGHDVPIVNSEGCVEALRSLWAGKC